MSKNKYKDKVKEKSIQGGTLVPFHKEGNTTYFKVFANNPNLTDSVLLGPNNSKGLALDNNEIVKETKKNIKVASDDLGTVNVIERLSKFVPIETAFKAGYNAQEAYKERQIPINFNLGENITKNRKRMFVGGDDETYEPLVMSNGRVVSMDQVNDKKEKYYDIVKARYEENRKQLKARGYKGDDVNRLARIMTYQNNLEGGWVLNRSDNNWGGMRSENSTTKKMEHIQFNTLDDYYNSWFKMLNERWPGWDKAKDYVEFANIINHDDLGLKTESEIKAYQDKYAKEHKGEAIYWYAPHYENGDKHYRDHLNKVRERSDYYMDIIDKQRPPEEEENLTKAAIQHNKQINEGKNKEFKSGVFDFLNIMKAIRPNIVTSDKNKNNQSSLFMGGRTRFVDGGNKPTNRKPFSNWHTKPTNEDLSNFTKHIDEHGKPYLLYKDDARRIYNVDRMKLFNYPQISWYDFNNIPVSDTIATSNNKNDKIINNNEDRPKDSNNKNVKKRYLTSSYEDRPKDSNSKLKSVVVTTNKINSKNVKKDNNEDYIENENFIGPILKTNILNNESKEPNVKKKNIVSNTSKINSGSNTSKINSGSNTSKINSTSITNKRNVGDLLPKINNSETLIPNGGLLQNKGVQRINPKFGLPKINNSETLIPNGGLVNAPIGNVVGNSPIKNSPTFINRLKLGWGKFKDAIKTPEGMLTASAATDVAGNVIANSITQNAIDSTRYVDAPIAKQASKMITSVNINPQVDTINNTAAEAKQNIDDNTLSSKAREYRLRNLGLDAALKLNQLYANKENIEGQFINQDVINQQNIANSNIDSYNQWAANKTEFENNKIMNKAQSTSSMINGIGQAIGNLATGLTQANQFNNNLELLKTLSPDAAKVALARRGGKFNKRRK
jgi:hypothetical protein